MTVINTGMGELKVAAVPNQLQTILGSCIGLVLFDHKSGIAALAHIMLPETDIPDPPQSGKFANTAVPALLAELARAGARRHHLRAKFAGGAAMFKLKPASESLLDIGARNMAKVRELLKAEGIGVLAEHCGGGKGRKVLFDPATGAMQVEVMGIEKVVL